MTGAGSPPDTTAQGAPVSVARSADEIQSWLTHYVAHWLDCEEGSVDVAVPFQRFGMDSSAAVGMAGDLEEWLRFEVEPTLPYDFPTIESLAAHLAEESLARAAGTQ